MGTTEFEGQRLSESRMPELGTYGSKGARGGDAPKLPTDRTLMKRIAIADAVNELLRNKEIAALRVADVCALSGIPRSTFYRYFYSLNDVGIWLFGYLLSVHFFGIPAEGSWQHALESLFCDMLKWKWLFFRFYNSPYPYDSILEFAARSAKEQFQKTAPKRLGRELTEDELLIVEYHSVIQASLCAKWAKDGMNVPPQKMALIMMEFLPSLLTEYIR